MSKTIIITSYPPPAPGVPGPHWQDLAAITCATHKKYADLHSYDYAIDVSNVQAKVRTPWVDDPKRKETIYAPLRTMIKFPLLAHYLDKEACRKDYEYVVWLDADVLITRFNLPLTIWINAHSSPLVLAYDVNGLHPTVIMVRNCVETRGLVWACDNAGRTMWMNHDWSDIMALRFYLATPPYEYTAQYYSAKELCAMPPGVYPIPPDVRAEYEWTPESFSLHLSALDLKTRVAIATKWVEDYKLL